MKENNNKPESGFKVNNILLLESSFQRRADMKFDQTKISHKFNIGLESKVDNDKVIVFETITYQQFFEGKEQVSSKITMSGQFEKYGDIGISPDEFGKINGPAIIFPFIREQLASLTLKAGIGPILLPSVNFVRLAQEKKK